MLEQIIEYVLPYIRKYGPLVVGGFLGAIIQKLRTQMSFMQFAGSIIISMFVALSVGIVSQEYFNLKEPVIFVLCGASGVFSKAVLDEIDQIIKTASGIIKSRYGRGDIEIIPSREIFEDNER